MKVRNVMHKGITCVEPDTPIREIAKRMRKYDIGAVPVRADGAIVGMVTDRDIACRALANSGNVARLTAKDVMTRNVVSCSPDEDIASAIRKMQRKKVRRLPVVNGSGGIVGMLSLGDISQKVSRQLSGEILRAVSAHHR